jgi:hypothetical protein
MIGLLTSVNFTSITSNLSELRHLLLSRNHQLNSNPCEPYLLVFTASRHAQTAEDERGKCWIRELDDGLHQA